MDSLKETTEKESESNEKIEKKSSHPLPRVPRLNLTQNFNLTLSHTEKDDVEETRTQTNYKNSVKAKLIRKNGRN